MGSKASKAAAEQASDAAPPSSVRETVETGEPHDENIDRIEVHVEESQEIPLVSQEQGHISDIEMIIQSGLHEAEELPQNEPARKSLSGPTSGQHGLSIQQAVQELKAKFSINAPLKSNGDDSLDQIRKEMDAYGVPLPTASTEAATNQKRSASLKSDGSSSSSDSDDGSDGSSSSSGSSLGFGAKRGIKRKANGDEVEAAEGSDDDFDEDEDLLSGKKGGSKGKITMAEAAALFATPNEVLEPQIPAVAVQELPATARLDLLGTIQSIIDNVIVVQASIAELGNTDKGVNQIIDEGSLVCTSDGKVVGPIFETFGAVTTPLYSLRLQTGSPFLSSLKTGERVYFCPEPTFSSLLYTRDIQKQSAKASDASNLYDEEPNDGEVEFSDDEAEQEYKRLAKVERKNRRDRIAWEKEQGANEGDVGAAEAEFEFDEDDMEGDDDIPEAEASVSTKSVAQQPTKMDLEDGEERSESAGVRSQGSPRNKVRRLSQGSENRGFVSQRGRDNARGAGRARGGRGAPRGRGGRQDGPSQRGGRGSDRDRGRGRGRGTFETTGGRGSSSFDNRGRGRGRESQQPDRYRNRSPTRSNMDGPYQPVRHSLPSRPHFQHPDALPYDGPSHPPSGPPQSPRSPISSLPSRPVSNLPQRAQTSAASHSSHSNNASAGRPELPQNGYSHGQGPDARAEAYNPASPSTSHFNGNMRATHGPLALLQNLQSNPFLTGMQFPMQMNPMAQQPYSPVSMVQQQFRPLPSVQPRQFPPTQAPFLARAEAAVATPTSVKRNKTWVNPQSKAGQTSVPQQTVPATPAPYQQVSVPPATTYVPHPTYAPAHMQGLNAPSGYNPAFGQNMAGQHAGRHSDNPIYNNRQGGHYQPPSRSQNVNEYEVRTQPRPH